MTEQTQSTYVEEAVTITLDREDAELLAVGDIPSSSREAKTYGEADARLVTAMRAALVEPQATGLTLERFNEDDVQLLYESACERGIPFADFVAAVADLLQAALDAPSPEQPQPSGLSDEDRVRLVGDVAIKVTALLERAAGESAPEDSYGEHGEESWWLQGRDETVNLIVEELLGYVRQGVELFEGREEDTPRLAEPPSGVDER